MHNLRSQIESRGTRTNNITLSKTTDDTITDNLEEYAIKSLRLQDELKESFNPDMLPDEWFESDSDLKPLKNKELEKDSLSELKESLVNDPDFSKPEEQIDMNLIYSIFGVDEVEQSIVDNKDQWRRI